MDTTKEYINMCQKAIEIQELWEPYFGDFLFASGHDLVSQVAIDTEREEFVIFDTHTWLPRQDQLQDIWRPDRSKTAWAWNSEFTAFLNVSNIYDPIEKSKMSMERLMLAFVMWEKYNKKWNGEDWISK